jgi:hypothetical protein
MQVILCLPDVRERDFCKKRKILTCTVLVDVLVSMAPDIVSRGADYVEYKI